jgi:hypothetical protein
VNLAEQGIIGPFNFSQTEHTCIDQDIWRDLEESEGVMSGSVDIDDLNRVTPLG